jgi:GNAT superfamily N-acetyltransferase
MSAPSIVAEQNPPKAWIEAIVRRLRNYNTAATGIVEFYPVVFLVKDASNSVSGGLIGNIVGGWLHIRSLWVDKIWRGRGYATQLMAAAERYAFAKGCVASFLQTASYEARPLYEKLGYRVFAELSDHPSKGHNRYFLAKQTLSAIDDGGVWRDRANIEMQPYASGDVMEAVNRGIQTHASAAIGLPEQMWFAANFFLRDEDGEILGGALGNTWGLWLYVSDVWVDPSLRGKGYATKLMTAIEQVAIQRGCLNSYLDTFSFQARPLYEKLGYEVFGTLENHPKGHSHYFLKKTL